MHKHPSKVIKLKTPQLAPFAAGFPLLLFGSLALFVSQRTFFFFFFLLATGLAVCRLYQSSIAFLTLNNENTIQQKFAPSTLTVANERRAVLLHILVPRTLARTHLWASHKAQKHYSSHAHASLRRDFDCCELLCGWGKRSVEPLFNRLFSFFTAGVLAVWWWW